MEYEDENNSERSQEDAEIDLEERDAMVMEDGELYSICHFQEPQVYDGPSLFLFQDFFDDKYFDKSDKEQWSELYAAIHKAVVLEKSECSLCKGCIHEHKLEACNRRVIYDETEIRFEDFLSQDSEDEDEESN